MILENAYQQFLDSDLKTAQKNSLYKDYPAFNHRVYKYDCRKCYRSYKIVSEFKKIVDVLLNQEREI